MQHGGKIAAAVLVAAASFAGIARADPSVAPSRVIDVPTAWLQSSGDVYASAGANHRGGGFAAVSLGFATIAEVGLVTSDRLVFCEPCDDTRTLQQTWTTSASFRIGLPADTWARGVPAIALGFERSFAGASAPWLAGDVPDLAQLYLVASERLGEVRVHAGASAWAASYRGAATGEPVVLGDGGASGLAGTIRPFAAIEWTPSQYPRTTVMAELAWVPELRADAAAIAWEGAWGVRYQALDWGSIELGVRHREDDVLAGATVLVRVNVAVGGK